MPPSATHILQFRSCTSHFLSSRDLHSLRRLAILKNVSVHILRHTALSHYAEVLTVAEVQTIAGHSNSQTTDKYIHVDREQMKQKLKANNMKFNM